jgi:hypothetical protein
MSGNQPANGRHVVHVEAVEVVNVPGAVEIAIGQTRYSGLYFQDNEVARAWAVESFQRGVGNGLQKGFTVNLYQDGSITVMSFEGDKTVKGDPTESRFEGRWTFSGGTGRFAGIQGGGTYEGESFGAMAYSNVSGAVSKLG